MRAESTQSGTRIWRTQSHRGACAGQKQAAVVAALMCRLNGSRGLTAEERTQARMSSLAERTHARPLPTKPTPVASAGRLWVEPKALSLQKVERKALSRASPSESAGSALQVRQQWPDSVRRDKDTHASLRDCDQLAAPYMCTVQPRLQLGRASMPPALTPVCVTTSKSCVRACIVLCAAVVRSFPPPAPYNDHLAFSDNVPRKSRHSLMHSLMRWHMGLCA